MSFPRHCYPPNLSNDGPVSKRGSSILDFTGQSIYGTLSSLNHGISHHGRRIAYRATHRQTNICDAFSDVLERVSQIFKAISD